MQNNQISIYYMEEVITFIKLFLFGIILNPYLLMVYASGLLIKSLGYFNKKWKY